MAFQEFVRQMLDKNYSELRKYMIEELAMLTVEYLCQEYTETYSNGKLKMQFFVFEDKIEGISRTWYPNGKPRMERTFSQDVENGERKEYYEDGTPKYIASYVDGVRDGQVFKFHDNGQIRTESFFVRGKKEGERRRYYRNGELSEAGQYLEGKRHGEYTTYYENSQPWIRTFYNLGTPFEDSFRWNERGELFTVKVSQQGRHVLTAGELS